MPLLLLLLIIIYHNTAVAAVVLLVYYYYYALFCCWIHVKRIYALALLVFKEWANANGDSYITIAVNIFLHCVSG